VLHTYTPVIPVLQRLRREDYKFKASLGYTMRPYVNNTTKQNLTYMNRIQKDLPLNNIIFSKKLSLPMMLKFQVKKSKRENEPLPMARESILFPQPSVSRTKQPHNTYKLLKVKMELGVCAQVVELLPSKLKVLTSNPSSGCVWRGNNGNNGNSSLLEIQQLQYPIFQRVSTVLRFFPPVSPKAFWTETTSCPQNLFFFLPQLFTGLR
jgi:hypothetical protein